LLGLNGSKIQGPLFASFDELRYSVTFDLAFNLETKFFLNLNFYPEALAVEAVLVAKLLSLHRPEALKEVFVHAGSGVVKAHRIIRGYRPIEERPRFSVLIQAPPSLESICIAPKT
jgi:hypothetical protein